jgi:hypothetical protein
MSIAAVTSTDDRAPHTGGDDTLCGTCHTNPHLRGGPYCDQCHPLSGHDAYRRSLCCDCRSTRYSAGRPRCTECHDDFIAARNTGQLPDLTTRSLTARRAA